MSSHDGNPPDHDARPVSQGKKEAARKVSRLSTDHSPCDTLEARCRSVVVAHLERYPVEAFSILPDDSWESIVQLRHDKTTPTVGTGGLDGTGRLLPAISDRFLTAVELANKHLSGSTVVDKLAWKDCVEYRFKAGGLTRPAALNSPWPVVIDSLKDSGDTLLKLLNVEQPDDATQEVLERQIQLLSESPMSVSLLQASGVGKSVKKFVKACVKGQCSLDVLMERPQRGSLSSLNKPNMSPLSQLEETLQRWKDVAANSGVQVNSTERAEEGKDLEDQVDLRLAESCQSWRDLFSVLQQRTDERRASQGARMREIRKNLATGRPRVIKVRPTKSRHDNIIDRAEQKKVAPRSPVTGAGGSTKLKALRKESAIATKLQKASVRPANSNRASTFGSAVAFASKTKSNAAKRKTGSTISLAGGKQMKPPYSKLAKGPTSLFKKLNKPGPSTR
jgi:hypothetical protein